MYSPSNYNNKVGLMQVLTTDVCKNYAKADATVERAYSIRLTAQLRGRFI